MIRDGKWSQYSWVCLIASMILFSFLKFRSQWHLHPSLQYKLHIIWCKSTYVQECYMLSQTLWTKHHTKLKWQKASHNFTTGREWRKLLTCSVITCPGWKKRLRKHNSSIYRLWFGVLIINRGMIVEPTGKIPTLDNTNVFLAEPSWTWFPWSM